MLILRKKPTIVKLIAAGIVVFGLILSLIPVIGNLDKDKKDENKDWQEQSAVARTLWPLCFMIGFVSDELGTQYMQPINVYMIIPYLMQYCNICKNFSYGQLDTI